MATSALKKPPAAAAQFVSTLFTSAMAGLAVRMPLRHDTAYCGTIIDADGKMVFVIDTNRERPDSEVTDIATLLVLALNVHAGYPPEAAHG
ncbi:UNVERIFIED_ORG: hypothetical protein GGI66_003594 [Rhizobium esperanzae]